MPIDITLVRCQDGSLRPATAHDQELMGQWRPDETMDDLYARLADRYEGLTQQ